jgi:hypothetical protein
MVLKKQILQMGILRLKLLARLQSCLFRLRVVLKNDLRLSKLNNYLLIQSHRAVIVKVVGKNQSENAGTIRRFSFFGLTSDGAVLRINAWMPKSQLNSYRINQPDEVEQAVQLYSVSLFIRVLFFFDD